MILISIESVLVVFVFLQHAVILQKVMIDKKRELERLETNKVSIQELWFLTRVMVLDWSNTVLSDFRVSVKWECYWYHDSCQEA